jgi:hypothetical protein
VIPKGGRKFQQMTKRGRQKRLGWASKGDGFHSGNQGTFFVFTFVFYIIMCDTNSRINIFGVFFANNKYLISQLSYGTSNQKS